MPRMLYSDEDKCDENAARFYEPNIKPEFNLDLLMTNNYICHLLVMEAELLKGLGFRSAYDGAQDHDLVLRAAACLWRVPGPFFIFPGCCTTGAVTVLPRRPTRRASFMPMRQG